MDFNLVLFAVLGVSVIYILFSMKRGSREQADQGETDASKSDSSMSTAGPSTSSKKGHMPDLSKYRSPELVAALDRLTSVQYSFSLLLQPALKIAWRSLYYQDAPVRMNELLTQIQGVTKSITNFNPSKEAEQAKNEDGNPEQAVAAGKKKKGEKSTPTPPPTSPTMEPQPARTFMERLVHFAFVGFPLSLLVGLLYGIVNFVTSMVNDALTVCSLSTRIFETAKSDLKYYQQHPEARPTKDEAIEAWSQQIIYPYTNDILKKKLGPLSFISPPVAALLNRVIRFFVYRSANQLENYSETVMKFNPFADRGQPAQKQDESAHTAPAS